MLTPEQIEEAKNEVFRGNGAQMRDDTASIFAAAIEAEIRKQDTALIRQMLEAIEAETSDTWECNSYHPKLYAAVIAARKRLKP